MYEVNNNSSVFLIKLISCAYAASAMAGVGVIFSINIFMSTLTAFCIVFFFYSVKKMSKEIYFDAIRHFDDANKMIRIGLFVCVGMQLVFVALGLSEVSRSPRTSISFGALSVLLIFQCLRIFNLLSLDYLDREMDKLEDGDENCEENSGTPT